MSGNLDSEERDSTSESRHDSLGSVDSDLKDKETFPKVRYMHVCGELLPLKWTPGLEVHPLDSGGARSTMNGVVGSIVHPGRGSGSVLLDLPGEMAWGSES